MMPPNMMNVPPQMVPPPQHNMNMGIGPPGMPPMMPPPVINPSIPPNRGNDDHRNNQPMDKRNDSGPPPGWRTRDTRDTRDKEREYRGERDRGLCSSDSIASLDVTTVFFFFFKSRKNRQPSERGVVRENDIDRKGNVAHQEGSLI